MVGRKREPKEGVGGRESGARGRGVAEEGKNRVLSFCRQQNGLVPA